METREEFLKMVMRMAHLNHIQEAEADASANALPSTKATTGLKCFENLNDQE